ncbi:MAG: GMC family oxidoreductase N-terminal domain-containing protein [Leptolyngbyaceae cyanobacterium bins.302]|nr:GMC family oxidoreductase N-terminal domain-containing protein [Leptolyngbyaceae cyanobacterium bins.302]
MTERKHYDYIIIGSGAAGSVAAHHLSTANPDLHILVLEAGEKDKDRNIHNIGSFVKLWGSEHDWKLMTEPQPGLADRAIVINQGKVVGGGSSVNALMYVRGNPQNFDDWSAAGATGWSYKELLPYFKALEDFEGGASEYHGVGGPLRIRDCPEAIMRSEEFLLAATEAGYDGPHWDYNGARQENGAGYLQFHVDDKGERVSGATAFLHPALKQSKHLKLNVKSEATRLLIEKNRAVGVEYVHNGKTHHAYAHQEVIVSAGALQTPKLLMLSGIGAADHLQALNIPVVADLPGVGQNLQDHLQLPIVFRTQDDRPKPSLLTGNALFVNTRIDTPDAAPDLQLNFTPAVPAQLAPMLDFGGPVCIFLAILVQPKSLGEVKLRSSNPQDAPLLNPNYLQDAADVQTLVKSIEIARSIASTKAFAAMNVGEVVPGTTDPTAIEGFIRSQASTLWHPAGTCKIGQDNDAVVDPQLRVRGIEGLRVADASVMPTVTSGNTVAASFLIGAKVADMILKG